MKLRYIRDELHYMFTDWPISLGLLGGCWLLVEVVSDIGLTVAKSNEWFSAAGAAALFGVGIVGFLVSMVQYSSNFEMAVSMGRTRKGYLISSVVANVVFTTVFALLAYPLSWFSEGLRRLLFATMPLSEGTLVTSNAGLMVFHKMFWLIPMGALTAVALGAVIGACCQRWGQYGFLIVWLGGIALSTLSGKLVELYAEGKTGIFTPVLDRIAGFFRLVGSWGLAGIVLVWLVALVLVLIFSFAVLRKAPIRGM
ncbi:hypothetical protein [uncultured Ruthenibacterium sp.]|uniref:hypothetical protein n=1 Tax=uncultured Ruthenibacterium sp. TaxID=1905347 RepID=UPI00349E93A2